ncbi:MAG TPA: class I SAM-dependent methyltransferase, partial [Elusimicrobiota bacterium]|nr:class I SAM-dependent methyltransferase [Elusimicrobiota bacterium]
PFQTLGKRVKLVEGDILKLDQPQHFDAIVSGLPFNNFTPEEVKGFLEHFKSPGARLADLEPLRRRLLPHNAVPLESVLSNLKDRDLVLI